MSELPTGAEAALSPLRAELRAAAEREAAAISAQAEAAAATETTRARAEADELLQAARAEGEAVARREGAARSAAAHRAARETVLRAQSAADAALDEAVAERAAALPGSPQYATLLESLRARAHALLGPDATIVEDPAGGITATAGSRRLDARLSVLAADASARLHAGSGT